MASLRSFLQQEPHPVKLKAVTKEGADKTVRVGESRSRWRDAEKALHDCATVEAVDENGEVLRVWQADPNSEDGEGDVDNHRANMVGANVFEKQLTALGRVISDAADASAARHADAYRLAYEQQAMLVKVLSERLQMLERAWHRLLLSQQQVEAAAANGEAGEYDPSQQNLQMVLGLLGQAIAPGLLSAMNPSPPPEPKPKPNGAKS